jgi:hypothetical protein
MAKSNLIVMPNGMPSGKIRETLSKQEVDLVKQFEAWCERRGLVLDLWCRDCLESGHRQASRVYGDNPREALSYHVTCAHADRVYGDGPTR